MRVAIIVNSFNLGGAEKLMYDVSEVLSRKGQEVYLISMKKAETDFEKKVCEDLKKRNINYFTISKPVGKGKIKAIIDIGRFLKKHKIDVAHTNGQSPDFYTRLSKFIYPRCKMVVTIHSTAGYSRRIEKILGLVTSAYTAVSEQAREYGIKKLGIKKEISVIINGVDHNRYENLSKKNANNILSVGRVMPAKNYVDIVFGMCNYLEGNPEAKWDIVGDISQDKGYYEKMLSMIPDTVKDRIRFYGAVTNPEEYYKKADCFILASEFEGCGIAYIEAMISGLPVIAREVGVIPEIEAKGGKIVVLDTHNVSRNINDALKMNEKQLDINKQICIDNYSIDAACDKYIDVYTSI